MIRKDGNIILLIFILILIYSCKKGELPIDPREPGEVITQTISIDPTYKYQAFYDFETNCLLSQNLKVDWDLAFSCDPLIDAVSINTAKYMAVWNTGETVFENVTDDSMADWEFDHSNGSLDSLAFGTEWRTNPNLVYVVDRGYSPSGALQGKFKCQILSFDGLGYTIKCADLDGTGEVTIDIDKNTDLNRVAFSYGDQSITDFEPNKEVWDLLFSQYTHVFPNGDTYLVTGVLHNSLYTIVAEDTLLDFESIVITDTNVVTFSHEWNTIGYDWKLYDFNAGGFTILPNINYLVRTGDFRTYKFRFIDFYDDQGNKGNPKFEFQEL